MGNKQYTQEEILELLNNPEKAALFKSEYEKEHTSRVETVEKKNNIFTAEDDAIPYAGTDEKMEEVTEDVKHNPYDDYKFDKNGSLMPLDNNGFDGMSNEEFMSLVNQPFTPEGPYTVPHASNNFIPLFEPPKLNEEEREILEITAQHGFMDMLREEFKNNPIDYEQAQKELEGAMLSEAQNQLIQLSRINS